MSITTLTAKVNVLANSLDRVVASAGRAEEAIRTVRPAMEESERATDSALAKLRQAADAFGNEAGSMGFNFNEKFDEKGKKIGGEASGGFLTAGYAYSLVEQYINILDELNSKSDLAMLHGPKLKLGLQQLEDFFAKFFPQFGKLSKLAKEWQNEMDAGAKKAATLIKQPKGSGSAPSSSSSSSATSGGLVL